MLFIGLDGGGTRTAACLADGDEQRLVLLGRGTSGPSNLVTVAEATALAHLEEAVEDAFRNADVARTQVESICVALAGSDREPIRQRVRQWAIDKCIARTVNVVHDAEPLLAGVDRTINAVALIAGTGSFAFGRAADGRTARVGGWGPVLGDEGGAYWIGLEALRWVSRVIDGRSEQAAMFDRLREVVGFDRRLDLVSCLGRMDRPSIAALAELVDQLANEEDEPAIAICASAARHLTEIVSTVVDQLALPSGEFALVVSGGVLLNRSVVSRLFLERLPATGLAPTSIDRCDDPAWGAVRIARSMQRAWPS